MKASVESIPVTPRAPAALKAAADTSTSQVTQTVRAGIECGDATGCVIPPLHLSSTFAFRGFADKGAYDYTRSGNPTRDLLGAALAELERGAGAVVTASGMAAVTLVGYLVPALGDRKSTRLNSSHLVISYAVFCLKKKNSVETASSIMIGVG